MGWALSISLSFISTSISIGITVTLERQSSAIPEDGIGIPKSFFYDILVNSNISFTLCFHLVNVPFKSFHMSFVDIQFTSLLHALMVPSLLTIPGLEIPEFCFSKLPPCHSCIP